MDKLRIKPKPKLSRMIFRMANAHTSIGSAINELSDNAVDAGASNVQIILDKENNTIIVIDDGKGIEQNVDLLEKIVGYNVEKQNSRGRYGIGLAEACRSLIDLQTGYYVVESIAKLDAGGINTGIRIRFPSYEEVVDIENTGKEYEHVIDIVPRSEFKAKGIKNGGTIVMLYDIRKRIDSRSIKSIKDAISNANDIIIREGIVEFQVGMHGHPLETVTAPHIDWVGEMAEKSINVVDGDNKIGEVYIKAGVLTDSGSAGVYSVLNGRCIENGDGFNFDRKQSGAEYFRLEVHIPSSFIEITPQKSAFVEDSINYIKTMECVFSDPDITQIMKSASQYEQEQTDKECALAFKVAFKEMIKEMPDFVKSIFRAGRGTKEREVLITIPPSQSHNNKRRRQTTKTQSNKNTAGDNDEGTNVVIPDFKESSFPRKPHLLVKLHKEKGGIYFRLNKDFQFYKELDKTQFSDDWWEILAQGIEYFLLNDDYYKKSEMSYEDMLEKINQIRFCRYKKKQQKACIESTTVIKPHQKKREAAPIQKETQPIQPAIPQHVSIIRPIMTTDDTKDSIKPPNIVVYKNTSKKCSICGEIKPITEYNKDRHTRDGLKKYCISCETPQETFNLPEGKILNTDDIPKQLKDKLRRMKQQKNIDYSDQKTFYYKEKVK